MPTVSLTSQVPFRISAGLTLTMCPRSRFTMPAMSAHHFSVGTGVIVQQIAKYRKYWEVAGHLLQRSW